MQLHYTVKLMNPKTEAGTYGTYDANGSQGYDGLYTNNSATLYPKATGTGRVGDGQDFLKPTVSYQINYYTVTVNFVDEDGNTIAPAYTSDSLKGGSAYDVTAQAAPAIQGYTYKVTTGDPLTGTLDGNKIITVVYTKDAVDPTPAKPGDTPHTGDSGSMLLWLSLAVVSGGAAVSALVVSKRKNSR